MPPDVSPTVSVVICSYRRNQHLDRAARSVLAQQRPDGLTLELVVVDNNPDGAAAPVAARLERTAPFPVRYVHEPVPNIAGARNAGIRTADGTFVAFLDDDEEATPVWVATLLATARSSGADLVFGPVEPVFAGGPPAWDPEGARYRKGLAVPDGAPAPILCEEGHAHRLGKVVSGNVLVRRACLDEAVPFDPTFGRSGGDDSDFFRRQLMRGRTAAWSQHALVHVHIPADRTSIDYMLRLDFRESQTYVRFQVKNAADPERTARRLQLRGLVQAMVWAVPSRLAALLPPRLALAARFGFARGMGKLRWRGHPRHGEPAYN